MLSTAQVPTAAVDILQFCLLMLSTAQVPTAAVDVSKAVQQQPLDISQTALTTEVAGGDGVVVSNITVFYCFNRNKI
jgi:hypothetical protein